MWINCYSLLSRLLASFVPSVFRNRSVSFLSVNSSTRYWELNPFYLSFDRNSGEEWRIFSSYFNDKENLGEFSSRDFWVACLALRRVVADSFRITFYSVLVWWTFAAFLNISIRLTLRLPFSSGYVPPSNVLPRSFGLKMLPAIF